MIPNFKAILIGNLTDQIYSLIILIVRTMDSDFLTLSVCARVFPSLFLYRAAVKGEHYRDENVRRHPRFGSPLIQ